MVSVYQKNLNISSWNILHIDWYSTIIYIQNYEVASQQNLHDQNNIVVALISIH